MSKLIGGPSTATPPWLRGEMEAPAGEKDMGGWTARIFTPEQQVRLGVDEQGNANTVQRPAVTFSNDIVYTSGHQGIVAGASPPAGFADEARAALEALQSTLKDANSSFSNICMVTCYLTSISLYKEFNAVYVEVLKAAGADSAPPSRACFAVAALNNGSRVEIECTAVVNGSPRQAIGGGNGIFSKAIRASKSDLVWASGQLALDPNSKTKNLVGGDDPGAQSAQALSNLKSVLERAGSGPQGLFRSTVFLTDITSYGPMNSAYAKALNLGPAAGEGGEVKSSEGSIPPARAAFAVTELPLGGLMEVCGVGRSLERADKIHVLPGLSASPVYSPAITLLPETEGQDSLVYVSGQVALDPASGTKDLVGAGDVEAEARQAFKNLCSVLEQTGSSPGAVLKTNVYCASIEDVPRIDAIYCEVFKSIPRPARTCVQVKQLPLGALVEVCCIASKK